MPSKATIAKSLGWGAAVLLAIQQAVQSQSVLPHDAAGWLKLVVAALVGLAIHHAASTDGSQ